MRNEIILLLLISNAILAESKISTLLTTLDKEDHKDGHTSKLTGMMVLNGFEWKTECECQPKKNPADQEKCRPSYLEVTVDKPGNGLTLSKVSKRIGEIKKLKYVKVSKSSFTCVDGRERSQSLSTLGGDAGEFLLALSAYQNYFNQKSPLSDKVVDRIFRSYLKLMKQPYFVMCTDDLAVTHIEKQLNIEGINLAKPRENIQDKLLDALMQPLNIGDLHLRSLLKHADKYQISPALVKQFFKSYYNNLWNNPELKDKIKLKVLIGDHNETAFIHIKSNPICTTEDFAPPMIQHTHSSSVFLNYEDAVQVRRAQFADFMAKNVNMGQDPIDPNSLFDRINIKGMNFIRLTGMFIGSELPFYSANIL